MLGRDTHVPVFNSKWSLFSAIEECYIIQVVKLLNSGVRFGHMTDNMKLYAIRKLLKESRVRAVYVHVRGGYAIWGFPKVAIFFNCCKACGCYSWRLFFMSLVWDLWYSFILVTVKAVILKAIIVRLLDFQLTV